MKTEIEKLTDTKAKREVLSVALDQLSKSEGWKFIMEVLRYNVSELQKMINDTNKEFDERLDWRVKVKREYQEQMIDMPQKFAEDLRKDKDEKDLKLDPYE